MIQNVNAHYASSMLLNSLAFFASVFTHKKLKLVIIYGLIDLSTKNTVI